MKVIEVSMEQRRNERVGEMGVPRKNRRPTASSGTIPTCENPELTTQPPWPKEDEVPRLKRRSYRQDKMTNTFWTKDQSTGPMRVKLGECETALECENPQNDPDRQEWRPVRLGERRVPERYTTTAPAASIARPTAELRSLTLQHCALALVSPLETFMASCESTISMRTWYALSGCTFPPPSPPSYCVPEMRRDVLAFAVGSLAARNELQWPVLGSMLVYRRWRGDAFKYGDEGLVQLQRREGSLELVRSCLFERKSQDQNLITLENLGAILNSSIRSVSEAALLLIRVLSNDPENVPGYRIIVEHKDLASSPFV
ncbi:hypothetical protein PR048_023481 [Dryococelus australis]|uniref:Uncharacterized protein n=1 Tax=Dryococelus australis TaxID=614101 RepID=A0ABQ9GU82_9NEOP|nr:hypothetical protein PR048_023481 [Dryococelus australis]